MKKYEAIKKLLDYGEALGKEFSESDKEHWMKDFALDSMVDILNYEKDEIPKEVGDLIDETYAGFVFITTMLG